MAICFFNLSFDGKTRRGKKEVLDKFELSRLTTEFYTDSDKFAKIKKSHKKLKKDLFLINLSCADETQFQYVSPP